MPSSTSYQVLNVGYPALWWSYTTNVRKLVEAYCAHATANPDFSERVAMTCHELLENAVKYSRDAESTVNCAVEFRDDKLYVSVRNSSTPENIESLMKEYDFVQGGDPLEIYILKMQADIASMSSQLGLARIRYEGEAKLDLAVQDEAVTMNAVFEMPERPVQHEQSESPSLPH